MDNTQIQRDIALVVTGQPGAWDAMIAWCDHHFASLRITTFTLNFRTILFLFPNTTEGSVAANSFTKAWGDAPRGAHCPVCDTA
jgi:hypothetical protein